MSSKSYVDRSDRLRSVISPLQSLDNFTAVDAKSICEDSSAGYVTRTLTDLIKDGLIKAIESDSVCRYRWIKPARDFDVESWIASQVHGLQVKETPQPMRPRERLLRDGAAALSNADLLAILIRVGVRNESAITGAQRIANRFADSIDEISRLTPAELKQISPAATSASYTQIMAGIELGRRVAELQSSRASEVTTITSTSNAVDYCRHAFARLASDAVQEEFHIVTLDTKHKPIHQHKITVGTLDASLVHPREVFRPAIRDSASAVLLVHNHPSGDPTPSREDHAVTDRLTEAGKLLGIHVLDHIIVARQRCLSIREES